MTLLDAREGEEYIIQKIATDDEDSGSLSVFSGLLQRRTHYRSFPFKGRLRGFH